MIACPVCGARTTVTETRLTVDGSARRRRRCTKTTCPGRLTTLEVVMKTRHRSDGGNVVISVTQLKKLREIVGALGKDVGDSINGGDA